MRNCVVLILYLSMAKRCAQFVLAQDFSEKRLCFDDSLSSSDNEFEVESSSSIGREILTCLSVILRLIVLVIVWTFDSDDCSTTGSICQKMCSHLDETFELDNDDNGHSTSHSL